MLLDPLEHEVALRLAAAGDRARSSDTVTPDRGTAPGRSAMRGFRTQTGGIAESSPAVGQTETLLSRHITLKAGYGCVTLRT